MSWDTDYRKEKCPCGKGYIVQETRSDDWNRTEDGRPLIECEECKKKYKVAEVHYFELPWRGDGVAYYLVPIDLQDKAVYEHKYSVIEPYRFAKNDFARYIICSYPRRDVEAALEQIKATSNCSKAQIPLKNIVDDRKKSLGSCKRKVLIDELSQALANYESGPNYELIAAEKERNEAKRNAFRKKIETVGKRIF
jgi:hypothetical protein